MALMTTANVTHSGVKELPSWLKQVTEWKYGARVLRRATTGGGMDAAKDAQSQLEKAVDECCSFFEWGGGSLVPIAPPRRPKGIFFQCRAWLTSA